VLLQWLVLLLCGTFCEGGGVGSGCGADEVLEGGGVDLVVFAEVDGAADVAFQAGVEEVGWVFQSGAAGEGELDDLLVGFARAEDAVEGEDGDAGGVGRLLPFALFDDGGVGCVDELADVGKGVGAPVGRWWLGVWGGWVAVWLGWRHGRYVSCCREFTRGVGGGRSRF
jgi:hypothetical protein